MQKHAACATHLQKATLEQTQAKGCPCFQILINRNNLTKHVAHGAGL